MVLSVPSRILIIDDDPQILKLFAKILIQGGHSVRAENSGKGALEALHSDGPFDLVVLDLSMPPPDGFETLKTLRIRRPSLKILVSSGFLEGALLKTSEILGATASMHKEDAPKLLLQTVNDLLKR
jgi:CheY-like chemotaxis protein